MASFLDLAGLTYFKQQLFSKLALKDEVVLLTPQTLTADQQAQALANIAALGLSGGTIKGALAVQGTMTVQTPTANANPATKQYVDEKVSASTGVPAGAIMFFGVKSIPDGWLICNGANVSRRDYAALFAAIGTTYGAGDGSSTFNLPNLNGRFLECTTYTSEVGTYKEAGLPNITGYFSNNGDGRYETSSGSFTNNTSVTRSHSGSNANEGRGFDFSASKSSSFYGQSSTVQPPAMVALVLIKS